MRAHDLLAALPAISGDTPLLEAARLLAEQDLPGLIVVDEHDGSARVVLGTQVLRLAVPGYCQDDPVLARVIDEQHADHFLDALAGRTVHEALPLKQRELPATDPDATVLELAALMTRTHSSLVAVVDGERLLGVVTFKDLLERVLAA